METDEILGVLEPVLGEFSAVIVKRLAALETKTKELPTSGKDGAPGLDGKNGRDGLDGKDGRDGLAGKDGATGKDGLDAPAITAELILAALEASPALLEKAVGLYLAAHPPAAGKDGAAGLDGKDGAQGLQGVEGASGRDGKDGRDGLDGKNGQAGLDGKAGDPGRDGRDGQIGPQGERGLDGIDGKDGLGLEDLDIVQGEDLRTITLKWGVATRTKERILRIPFLLWRGIFGEVKNYQAGDVVTKDGSLWHANKPTSSIPGAGSPDWTLCVKHGREGKSGPRGETGPKGLDGKDGRDLTQLGTDGRKW